jgi:hypothetical protein
MAVSLPSALPGYIFDQSGMLIDWSADPGDDQDFQSRWLKGDRQSLTVEQARNWIRKRPAG